MHVAHGRRRDRPAVGAAAVQRCGGVISHVSCVGLPLRPKQSGCHWAWVGCTHVRLSQHVDCHQACRGQHRLNILRRPQAVAFRGHRWRRALCNRSRPSAVRFAVEYAVDTQPLCDVLLPASRFLRFRKRGLGLRLLLLLSLGHARHGLCFPDPTSPLGVSPSQRGSDEIKIERENECYIRRMKRNSRWIANCQQTRSWGCWACDFSNIRGILSARVTNVPVCG